MQSSDPCIHDLLTTHAVRNPDNVAIMAPGRPPLTYGGLWAHVDSIVKRLNALGVGRRDRVAMVVPASPELAVAFLAVAAGATCAPLNPTYKADEYDFYLKDLNPKVLMLQGEVESPARAVALARGIPIVELTPGSGEEAGIFTLSGVERSGPICDGFARSGELALLLHTSGTTSRPKLVPLTHANIYISARNVQAALALNEDDRCLNIMPLFHIHGLIGALLSSLMAGGSVACAPGFYAPKFFDWMEALRPTWYTAVPSMHQAILARSQSSREVVSRAPLRFLRSSSAPLPHPVLEELAKFFRAPVIESYGMTEAAHQIASNPLPPPRDKVGSVGLGAGPEIAVMDQSGNFLPPGQRGEVVIRGPNVTPGYENNPAANNAAFTHGWFRTGDQGYLDADGYLFLTGRFKELINRGGEKISPREVEDVLMEHPAVEQAVAFAVAHALLGEDVAAAVVLREQSTASDREIRDFVAARIADFKIPNHLLIVDEIPVGPTGKVQRVGLAARFGMTTVGGAPPGKTADFAIPSTPVQEVLAAIWAEVLGVERVGCDDNFFYLGGDSILGAQVISRVRSTLHVELSMIDLFDAPTLTGLARCIEAENGTTKGSSSPRLQTIPRDRPLPLSYAQQALWFLDQLEPGCTMYNRPAALRFTGPLNVAALEQAFRQVLCRHEVLRTTFPVVEERPVPVVSPEPSISLPLIDLRGLPAQERQGTASNLATEEAQRAFDLAHGPLLRASLLRMGDQEHILLITMHHIVSDGWSSEIFFHELGSWYSALAAGIPVSLPGPQIQYADFAHWQREWLQHERLEGLLSYWRGKFARDVPVLELPTDHSRSEKSPKRGGRQSLRLPTSLSRELKTLSRQEGVTLFITLLSAFKTLLYRYTGQTDLLVATPTAGRNAREVEGTIGCFSNMLLLRTDLSGSPTFRALLGRVREVTLGAYIHQELPFSRLIEDLPQSRGPRLASRFQVMFNMRNVPKRAVAFSGLKVDNFPFDTGIAVCDLSLEFDEKPEGLSCFWDYDTSLFEESTIAQMSGHFQALLQGIIADPAERIATFSLAATAEHRGQTAPSA